VGFAANGPLHLPVMVEDIAQFEEIFGDDLVLASSADSNQPLYAYLPSAVRAFFRNGGRRCWVIRVADASKAESSLFPLLGLFRLESGTLTQACAPARSPGSWADSLAAGLFLRSHPVVVTSFAAAGSTEVILTLNSAGEVAAGDLLRFSFPGTDDVFWLFVDSVTPVSNTSPPSARRGQFVSAIGARSYWETLTSSPPSGSLPVCERITIDLFVQGDAGEMWSMTDLGLAPAHPRYWGSLPDDATLFAIDTPEALAAETLHPRFPLAGPNDGGFYLPIGVSSSPASPIVLDHLTPRSFPPIGPGHSNASTLDRDGLASFGTALFLDPSLAENTSRDLLSEAYYLQYQSPTPRKLTGIHAALAIEEATIIAAPDAVQRDWFKIGDEPLASPPESSPLQHPEWWHFADCNQKQDIPRVPVPDLPTGQFQVCDLQPIMPPVLTLNDLGGGRYQLIWDSLPGAVDYLEEAVDPYFATAAVKRQTATGNVTIYDQPPADYYYRVRRQIGSASSDYSNGVAIRIGIATGWQQKKASDYDDRTLFDVQCALLRMSAARGDLFAVLSVPEHYRENETAAHALQLKTTLVDETTALSFGGVYHPWQIGREEDDLSNLRSTPPDGAMAGIMAKRSTKRGPWISPANEKLSGVVALSPAISRDHWQLLQDSQINLVRQEPAGFLCLSAATLSDDDDLLPINVRRLLSFLRKTALLVGNQYVFEPLSDVFRRAVQRGFEKLLDELAHRGAFAGRTRNEQFQVVIDSGLNTSITADQGRFYVELRVAPSLPLHFLTVRLLQQADRTFVTEGR
jgi:Phage tail sheath protein subtilisin-like domain